MSPGSRCLSRHLLVDGASWTAWSRSLMSAARSFLESHGHSETTRRRPGDLPSPNCLNGQATAVGTVVAPTAPSKSSVAGRSLSRCCQLVEPLKEQAFLYAAQLPVAAETSHVCPCFPAKHLLCDVAGNGSIVQKEKICVARFSSSTASLKSELASFRLVTVLIWQDSICWDCWVYQ